MSSTSTLNIDDEWANFLSKNYNDDSSDCEKNNLDADAEEFEIEVSKPINKHSNNKTIKG